MKSEMMNVIKKDKKKLTFLMVLAAAAIGLMLLGTGESTAKKSSAAETAPAEESTAESLVRVENQLESILGKMDGVGKVEVGIRWSGEISEEYAYNRETNQSQREDGANEEGVKEELVLTDGKSAPVVTARHYPDILGVLVVAEGAANPEISAMLSAAVSSYLSVGENRIEVTAMEGSHE